MFLTETIEGGIPADIGVHVPCKFHINHTTKDLVLTLLGEVLTN